MTAEQLELIQKASEALKQLELAEGQPMRECKNCINFESGVCKILGPIFCSNMNPKGFYCSEFKTRRK